MLRELSRAFKDGSTSKGQAGKVTPSPPGGELNRWSDWKLHTKHLLAEGQGGCPSHRLLQFKAKEPSPLLGSFSAQGNLAGNPAPGVGVGVGDGRLFGVDVGAGGEDSSRHIIDHLVRRQHFLHEKKFLH